MKVLLIDTGNLQPQVIETAGGIREWYRLIKCDMIDITSLNIGGRYYDVIVDDEGLLKDGIKPTVLDTGYKPLLVGNLVIVVNSKITDFNVAAVSNGIEVSYISNDTKKFCRYKDVCFFFSSDKGNERTLDQLTQSV